MAKEPINTSEKVAAPAPTITPAPASTPVQTVSARPSGRRSNPDISPNRFPGGEKVATGDNKFNMEQMQKFAYFSKKNIVPNEDLGKKDDWKAYGEFCKTPKKQQKAYFQEYNSWKKDQETKEDMVLLDQGAPKGKAYNDYEDSKLKYDDLSQSMTPEERTEKIDEWKEELGMEQPIEISELDNMQVQELSSEQPLNETAPQKSGESLSVEDQYKDLKEQNKFGILTPDDQKKLEVLEKTVGKGSTGEGDEKTAVVSKYDKPEYTPEELKNGPFQEGDIIDYMYKEWLIGGANWLYIKSDKYARKYGNQQYDRFLNMLKNKKALKEETKSVKTTKTRGFEVDTDLKIAEDLERKHQNIDKNLNKEENRLDLISKGKYKEAKVSDELRKQLEEGEKKFGKGHIEKFCADAKNKLSEVAEDYKFIQNISSAIVSTEMIMEKVNDVNVDKKDKSVLSERQKQIAQNIARRANQIQLEGGDAKKFLNDLSNKSSAAHNFTREQIEKENINECGKTGIENTHLKDIFNMIEKKDGQEDKPNSMIEALEGNIKIDEAFAKGVERINAERSGLKYRSEDKEKRRERVTELKEKLDRKDSVLDTTRHADGSQKTSSTVLVNRLADSKVKDQASGTKESSESTKIIIQELNKNKSK